MTRKRNLDTHKTEPTRDVTLSRTNALASKAVSGDLATVQQARWGMLAREPFPAILAADGRRQTVEQFKVSVNITAILEQQERAYVWIKKKSLQR